MKRRGLNFITDQHEMTLDQESIDTIEKEVDNVAPKIIGILALGGTCDTALLKQQLQDHCEELGEQIKPKNKKNQEMNDEEEKGTSDVDLLKAYICPNAGSSSNLVAKKQRLIFVEINREDVYSILDIGKVADLVLMVMSCKETNTS